MSDIRVSMNGGLLVAAAGGQLGREDTEELGRQVGTRLDAGAARVLLDFSAVSYMNSSALGAVIALLQRVRQAGGTMAVCAADERVHLLMEVAGLDHLLKLCRDRESAEAALHAGADGI
jgi:anti-sigma B factor antagonist